MIASLRAVSPSHNGKLLYLPKDSIYLILIGAIGILGAQRFTLDSISANICIIPLLLALGSWRAVALRNTLLVFALFISVDNGAGVYAETSWPLRYAIYFAVFVASFNGYKMSIPRLILAASILSVPFLISFSNLGGINSATYIRDVQIALLVLLTFSRSAESGDLSLDIKLLVMGIMCFLMAEVVNAALLFAVSEHQYLSFDSTKSLIVVPAFYYLVRTDLRNSLILMLVTLFVIFNYGTRMLTLVFLVTYLPYGVYTLARNKISLTGVAVCILAILAAVVAIAPYMDVFRELKAIAFLLPGNFDGPLMDIFKGLDPIRYFEHVMFFNRGVLEIVFGSGYGSGLIAANNELYFVSPQATAFSAQELTNDVYFNLHDVWIDVGLRFGLIFVVGVYLVCIRRISNTRIHDHYGWFTLIVIITCASFSSAGLLLIYFLWNFASSKLCSISDDVNNMPSNSSRSENSGRTASSKRNEPHLQR